MNAFAASIPVGTPERGNFGGQAAPQSTFVTKKLGWQDLPKEERIRRAVEGRKRAVSKLAYGAAIRDHCLQCAGVSPSITDCGGAELVDGSRCRLFDYNSPGKRRNATKKAIKQAMKAECDCCGGSEGTCGSCHLRIIRAPKMNNPAAAPFSVQAAAVQ